MQLNIILKQGLILLISTFISMFFVPANVLASRDIYELKIPSDHKDIEPEKYALLLGGGTNNQNNFDSFYANIAYVYDVLRQLGYKKKNIKTLFLGGVAPSRPIVDGEATKKRFLTELENFAKVILPTDSMLLFRSGHGTIELIFDENMEKSVGTMAVMQLSDGTIDPIELQTKLDKIDARHIMLILSQCYSGQFTEIADNVDNVVVVTETDALGYAIHQTQMKTGWKYEVWPFVKCLFDGFIHKNSGRPSQSLAHAFQYMLKNNPNIIGVPIRADRPLLKESPQVRYGSKLSEGTISLD